MHEDGPKFSKGIEVWQSLVHVCRRWRSVIFGSPRRLNLRLVCTTEKLVRDRLDVWPAALPLVIEARVYKREGVDNIIAALDRRERVGEIAMYHINRSLLEKVLASMQEPFPELTDLQLTLESYDLPDEPMSVLPDSFLGGSVPRLKSFVLENFAFPALPNLLLSASHLATLSLWDIPSSEYFSPKAMVTSLSALTNLKSLCLRFKSFKSHPDWEIRHLPPPTRLLLPALTFFEFQGIGEYLDDLVACIDAPRLDDLTISFFFETATPQVIQFISRTPALGVLEKVCVTFEDSFASVGLSSRTRAYGHEELNVEILRCERQVSDLEQACSSCLPPFFMLEDLYIFIYEPLYEPDWQHYIEHEPWLELLRSFTTVKNFYLSEEAVPYIAPVLQELVLSSIRQFVAARQVTSHPIAVASWKRKSWEER